MDKEQKKKEKKLKELKKQMEIEYAYLILSFTVYVLLHSY